MEELRFDKCFVCGKDNPKGLRLSFSYCEGKAVAEFALPECYEGYPGIIHGGIISTLLDEAMAKAIIKTGTKAVTAQLSTHFRKPLQIGVRAQVSGWITEAKTRTIKANSQITDTNGTVIATAEAVFFVIKIYCEA